MEQLDGTLALNPAEAGWFITIPHEWPGWKSVSMLCSSSFALTELNTAALIFAMRWIHEEEERLEGEQSARPQARPAYSGPEIPAVARGHPSRYFSGDIVNPASDSRGGAGTRRSFA
jgi:hypothetical protein